jgi:hypothetical protein
MNRRFLAGLAPLVAVTAFAVAPAVAHAEPHWYKNKVLVGPLPETIPTAGTLTLNALGAVIKCKVNDAEEIWNPVGGPGVDSFAAFTLTGCKNKVATPACPKGPITVTAEALPWPSRLFSTPPPGSVIRDSIGGVRINVGCLTSAGTPGDVFEGSPTPEVAANALIFGGPGGGTLLDGGGNPLTVTGIDKFVMPKTKITAKNP